MNQDREPMARSAPRPCEMAICAANVAVDVSIIVVNWNTLALLRDCLRSIEEQTTGLLYEVIVVDNGSVDGSPEMVESEFPRVCLIRNQENWGFAAANNQGIQIARGEFVLLLNSDTRVLDHALVRAVAFARAHADTAVVGCRTLLPDGSIQHNCYLFPSLLNLALSLSRLSAAFPRNRFFGRARLTWWDYDTPREVDVVAGCFMLVRRAALDQVGEMSERFYMYSEDTEWCWRFHRHGWKVRYTPDAVIIHHMRGSTSQCAEPMRVLERRSMLMFMEQRSGRWARWAANAMFACSALVRLASLAPRRLLGKTAEPAHAATWELTRAALRFHLLGQMPAIP